MVYMPTLYDISCRFEIAVRQHQNLPLICYALDEDILPSEIYEEFKCRDVSALVGDNMLFYGVLLLWVRNFYEKSNGGECWSLTSGLDNPAVKDVFQRRCRSVNVLNNAIPRFNQEARPWLTLIRSQCWLIKSNSSLSDLLRFNQRMYCLLSPCGFFSPAVAWNDIELNIDDGTKEDIEDFVAYKPYLKYIWDNYPIQYICSLKAIVSSPMADRDENAPSWIRPLIGLAGDSINSYYTWKLLKRSDNSLSPALILSGNLKNAQIRQGNICVHNNGSGIYHLWYLMQQGIDVKETFNICSGVNEEKVALPLSGNYMIFSIRGDKKVIEKGDKISGGAFFLFASEGVKLNVMLQDANGEEINMYGENVEDVAPGLQCLQYRIPYIPQRRTKKIIINDEDSGIQVDTIPRIILCNSCDVSVVDAHGISVVESREIRFYAYGMHNVQIAERRIREVEPGTCYYQVTLAQECGEIVIQGTSDEGNVNSRLRLLVLPADWSQRCEHDDLSRLLNYAAVGKNYVKYSDPGGRDYHLRYPLTHPICIWGNLMNPNAEYHECINTEQYATGNYKAYVYAGNIEDFFVEVLSGGVTYRVHIDNYNKNFLTEVFQELKESIAVNADVQVKVGTQLVYDGKFLPHCCCLINGKLYCHKLRSHQKQLELRHELYYVSENYIAPVSHLISERFEGDAPFVYMELPAPPEGWCEGAIQYLLTEAHNQYRLVLETSGLGVAHDWDYDVISEEWENIIGGKDLSMLPVRWFVDRLNVQPTLFDGEMGNHIISEGLWVSKMNRLVKAPLPDYVEVSININDSTPFLLLLSREEENDLLNKMLCKVSQECGDALRQKWSIINPNNVLERKLFLFSLFVCIKDDKWAPLSDKEKCAVCALGGYLTNVENNHGELVKNYIAYVESFFPSPLEVCVTSIFAFFKTPIDKVDKIDLDAAEKLTDFRLENQDEPWQQLVNNFSGHLRPIEGRVWGHIGAAVRDIGCSASHVIFAALYWYLGERYPNYAGNVQYRDTLGRVFGDSSFFYSSYISLKNYLDDFLPLS